MTQLSKNKNPVRIPNRIFNVDPTGLAPVSLLAKGRILLHKLQARVHGNDNNKKKKDPQVSPFSPQADLARRIGAIYPLSPLYSPINMMSTLPPNESQILNPIKIWSFGIWSLFVIWSLLFGILGIKNASAAVLQKPPANLGLVGYWPMNEGTSTFAGDFSGNGNKGTLTSMALNPSTPSSGWNSGKLGKALSFDGSDDYVKITSDPFGSGSFTVAAWVKSSNLSSAPATGSGIAKSYTSGVAGDWMFGVQSSGGISFSNFSDSLRRVTDTNLIIVNQWYHIVVMWDGTNSKAYVNGNAVSFISTGSFGSGWPSEHVIGRTDDFTGYYWSGLIDEVRVYNRALSASEVAALYKSGAAKHNNPANLGLVGYWSLNEGNGNIAGDSSGNKNTGVLTNFTGVPSTGTSTSISPPWAFGKRGNALSFDGSDDKVIASSTSPTLDLTGNITISAWIYPRSFGGGSKGRIVSKLRSNEGWIFSVDNSNLSGGLHFGKNTGTGAADIGFSSANIITLNQWQHVAVVWTGGATGLARFYVNGVAKGTDTYDSGAINSSSGIGAAVGGDPLDDLRQFLGLIDEVRIYNRALSASEVAALYNSGAAKINAPQNNFLANGLVGMWSFNGKDMSYSGTQALDTSGNKNHGTLTLGPTRAIGKVGQALSFDGVDDYVAGPNISSLFPNEEATFSAWVKRNKHTPTDTGQTGSWFFNAGAPGTFDNHYPWTDGLIYDGSFKTGRTTVGAGIVTDRTQWHQVAITRKAGTNGWKFYQNGKEIASVDGGIWDMTTSFRIGESNSGYNFFGLIDEVRIYNRALSAREVKQLYDMGR